ncbi:MAG: antibiotic biosynthesis monooxygenase [Chloroflexota bacterium]|nr:antibiotic biosynthesis monooxygenase [Chloroflexota bacterium]
MVSVGLLATLKAKPGKEAAVEEFLTAALPIVEGEPDTVAWFAIRMDPSTYGIFDVFPGEPGRQAHLNGEVAAALMARAPELFDGAPDIAQLDILASKLPAP